MERKATDVLLDLESKIDKILQYLVVIDSSYKIILSRLDKLSLSKNDSVNASVALPNLQSNKLPQEPVLKQTQPQKEDNSLKQEDIVFTEEVQTVKNDKVRVSQVVKYPKEKNIKNNNVILALVKIYDSLGQHNGKVVGETRTDQNGRWKTDLVPGKYFVHITKPASAQKPQIDHYFDILVDGNKKTLELESIG